MGNTNLCSAFMHRLVTIQIHLSLSPEDLLGRKDITTKIHSRQQKVPPEGNIEARGLTLVQCNVLLLYNYSYQQLMFKCGPSLATNLGCNHLPICSLLGSQILVLNPSPPPLLPLLTAKEILARNLNKSALPEYQSLPIYVTFSVSVIPLPSPNNPISRG